MVRIGHANSGSRGVRHGPCAPAPAPSSRARSSSNASRSNARGDVRRVLWEVGGPAGPRRVGGDRHVPHRSAGRPPTAARPRGSAPAARAAASGSPRRRGGRPGTTRAVWTESRPTGLNSGDVNCGRQPRSPSPCPRRSPRRPAGSRRSTNRRPNQIASALPPSSSLSWAMTRCGRRPKPGSTRTASTRHAGRLLLVRARARASGRSSLKSSYRNGQVPERLARGGDAQLPERGGAAGQRRAARCGSAGRDRPASRRPGSIAWPDPSVLPSPIAPAPSRRRCS